MLKFLSSIVPVPHFILPNRKCSFLFRFHASADEPPRFVNSTGLMLITSHLVILILPPRIENTGLYLIALDHVGQVYVLIFKFQRFQCIFVPLMESCFLLIRSDFVANHGKRFELVLTILVELRVLVQLSERGLDHMSLLFLNQKVEQFAGKNLCLPSSLVIDDPALMRFVNHSFIENNGELLYFPIEILTIGLDSCNLRSFFDIYLVETHIFSIQGLNLHL